jgi:hypothetical protein
MISQKAKFGFSKQANRGVDCNSPQDPLKVWWCFFCNGREIIFSIMVKGIPKRPVSPSRVSFNYLNSQEKAGGTLFALNLPGG